MEDSNRRLDMSGALKPLSFRSGAGGQRTPELIHTYLECGVISITNIPSVYCFSYDSKSCSFLIL